MTWYYVNHGEPAGPISEEELLSKLRLGTILPTTLIWRSGMAEWQPAAAVAPPVTPAPAVDFMFTPSSAASLETRPEPGAGPPPVLPNFFCTFCGNIIPADQLVRISGRPVCATCKPLYVQQTQEGLDAPVKVPILDSAAAAAASLPDSDLADPLIRLVAHILDIVFISVPVMIGYILVFSMMGVSTGPPPDYIAAAMWIGMFGFFGLAFAAVVFYWTWFIGRSGATPGMRIMKIKMVRSDRSPVLYGRAFGRFLLFYALNQCTMGLTNLTAFFDRERRTVVDMMCDTRVVRS
jgi:uncharacterized RDD family membrane protein YckC